MQAERCRPAGEAVNVSEIIAEARTCLESGDYKAVANYLDEIESGLTEAGWLWPPGVMDAAISVFGPPVQNVHGRTYKAMDKRVRHACKVWGDRWMGLIGIEQWEYAGAVLSYTIIKAYGEAQTGPSKFPYVYRALESVVHNDKVHLGFEKRRPKIDTINIADLLHHYEGDHNHGS